MLGAGKKIAFGSPPLFWQELCVFLNQPPLTDELKKTKVV